MIILPSSSGSASELCVSRYMCSCPPESAFPSMIVVHFSQVESTSPSVKVREEEINNPFFAASLGSKIAGSSS
ncbi:MAG: hypothetical protein ACTSRO_12095 [Candidatus Heimdallarchaeaceae archaeon]